MSWEGVRREVSVTLQQAWANPGFLGADIYLQTQDKSTTIHEQIIANLYYVMKLFADIRNYIQTEVR